jgi:hypothetical protein
VLLLVPFLSHWVLAPWESGQECVCHFMGSTAHVGPSFAACETKLGTKSARWYNHAMLQSWEQVSVPLFTMEHQQSGLLADEGRISCSQASRTQSPRRHSSMVASRWPPGSFTTIAARSAVHFLFSVLTLLSIRLGSH